MQISILTFAGILIGEEVSTQQIHRFLFRLLYLSEVGSEQRLRRKLRRKIRRIKTKTMRMTTKRTH